MILSNEQALDLVKTPRGLMVSLIRSIAPLQEVVPFELMGVLDQGDEDGRPFDPRLLPDQMDVIEQAYQSAYAQSSSFAESVQKLFSARCRCQGPIRTIPSSWLTVTKGLPSCVMTR